MKKVIALFLCFTMLFALVSCLPAKQNGGPENNLSGKKIEMATQTAGKSNELLVKLIEQFKQETGIEVVLTSYDANDYESALKTRMASQELPDVWLASAQPTELIMQIINIRAMAMIRIRSTD